MSLGKLYYEDHLASYYIALSDISPHITASALQFSQAWIGRLL